MIRRLARSSEAGYTFMELVVALIIVGVLVLLLMPSLSGYQAFAQVRLAAATAVAQLRQAQSIANAEDQEMYVMYNPSGDLPSRGNKQGWEVCIGTANCTFSATWTADSGAVIRNIVPNSVYMTAYCYRGAYMPNGQYLNWAGVCSAPGASVEAMCFDGNGSSGPSKIYVTIVLATGQVTESGLEAGACP